MLALPVIALVLAAVTATPTPKAAVTPAAVRILPAEPSAGKLGVSSTPVPGRRSLSDFAREAKKPRAKGAGSVTTYDAAGSMAAEESSTEPLAGDEIPATSLRAGSVLLQGVTRDGSATFSGTLKNTSTRSACRVRVTIQAFDDASAILGATTVVVDGPVQPGAETSYEGTVRVPTGTLSPDEAKLGGGNLGTHVKELGMKVLSGLKAQVASASACS